MIKFVIYLIKYFVKTLQRVGDDIRLGPVEIAVQIRASRHLSGLVESSWNWNLIRDRNLCRNGWHDKSIWLVYEMCRHILDIVWESKKHSVDPSDLRLFSYRGTISFVAIHIEYI